MAVEWTKLAWTLDLSPTQMLVAQAMGDYANSETALAWPSQKTLAWKTGLVKRSVWEQLRELEQLGVLIKVAEPRQHKPAVYRFNPDPPVARKPKPESQEHPPSEPQPVPSESQTTASRVAGDANKPSGTINKPSSTDREEARRIAEKQEASGTQINNRASYEAKVAANLAEETNQREQAQQAAALIAECELCNDQGWYFKLEPGEVAETGFRCPHANA